MNDNTKNKLYSITEVSSMLQVPQHVLRLWESQFDSIIPTRGRNGRRYYDGDVIQTIRKVQELVVHQGLDLEVARAQMTSSQPSLPFSAEQQGNNATPVASAHPSEAGIDQAKLQQALALLERATTALSH